MSVEPLLANHQSTQANVIVVIKQLNNGIFADKKIFAASMPHLKNNLRMYMYVHVPHYFKKMPHFYRIILKNYRIVIACFPS